VARPKALSIWSNSSPDPLDEAAEVVARGDRKQAAVVVRGVEA
jgi:hypothetical protein